MEQPRDPTQGTASRGGLKTQVRLLAEVLDGAP